MSREIRDQDSEVVIMLDMMETEMRTNDLHFAKVNLTIDDVASLLENDGWQAQD